MIGWLRHQKHALAAALHRLRVQPVATLLTALAMGVAISLPSGLYLALGNLGRLAGDLPAQPEISVFLDAEASAAHKQAIAARLQQPDIAQARYVPKEDALAALSAAQDLTDITAGLTQNPLPDAWVVHSRASSREERARVAADLGRLPGVAEAHLDSQWAERLQAALVIGRSVVWLLAGLFAIALIAISGNAIRALVLARRDEIQVSRLIGATDRHIRRPFLYLGALQGLLGGLAAGGVLALAAWVLRAPVEQLAGLYGSTFHLLPPTAAEMAIVLGLTTLSGWLGAWLTVTRTLRQVMLAR
ncbi:permease-like cell division protein FtsX [Thiobacillus denitrificans]|uniref:permease-like cell division protein FtsX n=1 Tax=Thiobacillus denitrificans TaxID=36861 RepID=UPI00037BC3D2|nr:permease-like cell division protein FtsX [Thiobacillus denitrificans]